MNFLGLTQPQNLAGYYQTCTMQNLQLDTAGSTAYNIPFPCSGKMPDGTTFDTSTCYNNELPWIQYAEQYVKNTLGVNIDGFQQR